MIYPRMTNNPHVDADAVERYHREQRNSHDYKRCRKCKCRIEHGEDYFGIPDDFNDLLIFCEDCIDDFKREMEY